MEAASKEAVREVMIADKREATLLNIEVMKTVVVVATFQKETAAAQNWTEVEIECQSRMRNTLKETTMEIRILGTRIHVVGIEI